MTFHTTDIPRISHRPFGATAQGEAVTCWTIAGKSLEAEILDCGGAIRALRTLDAKGNWIDVALGFDSMKGYEGGGKYLGALIGRCGNRIGKARFTLNGKEYALYANDGPNHLHGGKTGFNLRMWKAEPLPEAGALRLTYHSPDGEEGYPGNLTATVLYSVIDGNTLSIDYTATSDQDTVCNMTNHVYFNLAGHASGDVLNQYISIAADKYTESDRESLPTGVLRDVSGTPMDLRAPTPIGQRIDDSFQTLQEAGGYDHNWVISGYDGGASGEGALRLAATAFDKNTGVTLTAKTTLPGVQFYTGNYLDGSETGKEGAVYTRRAGFCLETQFFPNAMAVGGGDAFPQPVLRAGETMRSRTTFTFGLLSAEQ